MIFALGRRSVPAASIRACRFDPEPEMRTVILCMRDVVDESILTIVGEVQVEDILILQS